MNRRDLLKFFGAGSIIAPVVAGAPQLGEQAMLLAEPKIHVPEPPKVVTASFLSSPPSFVGYDVTVILSEPLTGKVTTVQAQSCHVERHSQLIEVTSLDSPTKMFLSQHEDITIRVRGQITATYQENRR